MNRALKHTQLVTHLKASKMISYKRRSTEHYIVFHTSPREESTDIQCAVSEPDLTREDSATISTLLTQLPVASREDDFGAEQRNDPELMELITYLEEGKLPSDDQRARQITPPLRMVQSHHRRVAAATV